METEQILLGWSRSSDGKGEPTYHPVEVGNCVTSGKRDNTQNYVMEPTIAAMRGRDKDNLLIEPTIISPDHGYFKGAINTDTGPTVKCSAMQAQHFVSNGIRIRRLTERELFRLMDVDEADIDILLSAGIAKTQLAKMAGNSIVVACLEGIFRNLFIDTEPQAGMQTKLF